MNDEELLPLLELVEYEKKIKSFSCRGQNLNAQLISKKDRFSNLNDFAKNVMVEIESQDMIFKARVDRPFIHQVGGRIWSDKKTYMSVAKKFLEAFNENKNNLERDIAAILQLENLVIRYTPEFLIYGVVSEYFAPSDQIAFRNHFLNEAQKSGLIDIRTSEIKGNRNRMIQETFHFDTKSHKLEMKLGITYGLNTGYSSYKATWHRKTKEDKLWLTPFESEDNFEWRNNSRANIKDFVNQICNEGKLHAKEFELILAESMTKKVSKSMVNNFFDRFKLAYATVEKVKGHLMMNIDPSSTYISQFAISSSLRFIGSKDQATPTQTAWKLIELGTILLNGDFENHIRNNTDIKLMGHYSLMSDFILDRAKKKEESRSKNTSNGFHDDLPF